MARIAVTDGMSDEAVEILENAGHEVVLRHHEPEEIANGSSSCRVETERCTKRDEELQKLGRRTSVGAGFAKLELAG